MTIVSQNYNEMIKNLIINEISKATINLTLNSLDNVNNSFVSFETSDNDGWVNTSSTALYSLL